MRTLRPDAGHVLTQAADVSILERVFSPEICLAAGDDPGGWKDITQEEASALMAEQRAALEALRAQQEKERRRAELEAELKALDYEQQG